MALPEQVTPPHTSGSRRSTKLTALGSPGQGDAGRDCAEKPSLLKRIGKVVKAAGGSLVGAILGGSGGVIAGAFLGFIFGLTFPPSIPLCICVGAALGAFAGIVAGGQSGAELALGSGGAAGQSPADPAIPAAQA
jgi:hypothetical protein